MKQIYFLFGILILLTCCSKTESTDGGDDPDNPLEACFEIPKDTLSIGEILQITDCSVGATTYTYNFGNGESSEEDEPSVAYQEGGDYTISLTVSNSAQASKSFSLAVHVPTAESSYIFPDIADGYSAIPMESGIHPVSGNLYCIELLEDNIGPGGSKFYYKALDENYTATSNYIADKPFQSNSAFVNVLASGNMNFHFSRTLDGLYGTQEITYNSAWGFINGINSADKHSYGYIPVGANYLYYGTEEDAGLYKTAVETRNSTGDAFQIALNAFGDADSMLGDMIAVDGGYVAFGGVFTKNLTAPHITAYKPLLVFFDLALNVTSHIIFESSVLADKINSANDLNGSFHLGQLSNGNLVLYAHGELIVTNSSGTMIVTEYFEGTTNNQALLSQGSTFILSSDDYLRKYDSNGTQLRALKYNGQYLPEILNLNGSLIFVAGYEVEGEVKMFYGACDNDLNLINLNE